MEPKERIWQNGFYPGTSVSVHLWDVDTLYSEAEYAPRLGIV